MRRPPAPQALSILLILSALAALPAVAAPPTIVGGVAQGNAAGEVKPKTFEPPVKVTPPAGRLPESQGPEKGFGCDFLEFIDFDDMSAPNLFIDTMPLTDEYEAMFGIVFSGPGPGLGGAVLNEASDFGVTGFFTPPNFLAFNDITYAIGPETFTFAIPASYIEIWAGSGLDSGTATMQCFDAEDMLAGEDSIAITAEMQPLVVDALNIVRCELDFTSATIVFDNLSFSPCTPVEPPVYVIPAQTPTGLAALILLLAAAGVIRLARK